MSEKTLKERLTEWMNRIPVEKRKTFVFCSCLFVLVLCVARTGLHIQSRRNSVKIVSADSTGKSNMDVFLQEMDTLAKQNLVKQNLVKQKDK